LGGRRNLFKPQSKGKRDWRKTKAGSDRGRVWEREGGRIGREKGMWVIASAY